MNEKSAQNQPYKKILGGQEATMEESPTKVRLSQDEVYERRIFELETHINHLECLLMLAEADCSRYKRQTCA